MAIKTKIQKYREKHKEGEIRFDKVSIYNENIIFNHCNRDKRNLGAFGRSKYQNKPFSKRKIKG